MSNSIVRWDYLIVTASNTRQAEAYESQLAVRRKMGLLPEFGDVLVVADPQGQRVGSGGSTIFCLMHVINRELGTVRGDWAAVESILRRLRILIVHAGGDSRRLPAYGPCGKIFIPVPGESQSGLGVTLFDRLLPGFANLPAGVAGAGQVVMAAGDALILLDSSNVSFAYPGMTALTCPATPEHASKHGVFCPNGRGQVRLYLQKPRPEQQKQLGAINAEGQSLLDIGIMSFDCTMAMALLKGFRAEFNADEKLEWTVAFEREVLARGIDFYREICCALGTEATAAHHLQQTRNSGSNWADEALGKMFQALAGIPFHLQSVSECRFLHFGTTRQLITSGTELREYDRSQQPRSAILQLNNQVLPGGEIVGASSWVEGCQIGAPLKLAGQNVVVGLNVLEPLILPEGACIDVLQGQSRSGKAVWFIRCYGISDTFKDSVAKGATFCGYPLTEWLKMVGANPGDIWDSSISEGQRSLWNAKVFSAAGKNEDFRAWLWMFEPGKAILEQKKAFLHADRYSASEISNLADQQRFFIRRSQAKS